MICAIFIGRHKRATNNKPTIHTFIFAAEMKLKRFCMHNVYFDKAQLAHVNQVVTPGTAGAATLFPFRKGFFIQRRVLPPVHSPRNADIVRKPYNGPPILPSPQVFCCAQSFHGPIEQSDHVKKGRCHEEGQCPSNDTHDEPSHFFFDHNDRLVLLTPNWAKLEGFQVARIVFEMTCLLPLHRIHTADFSRVKEYFAKLRNICRNQSNSGNAFPFYLFKKILHFFFKPSSLGRATVRRRHWQSRLRRRRRSP
jgi:hypothetical protein